MLVGRSFSPRRLLPRRCTAFSAPTFGRFGTGRGHALNSRCFHDFASLPILLDSVTILRILRLRRDASG